MRPPLLIAALPLAVLLAGCGHGIPSTQAASTTSSNKQASALKFAQCMRSHGVNIPDPQTSGSGGSTMIQIGGSAAIGSGSSGAINIDGTTFQNAQKACGSLLPNGGQLSPQQQAKAQQNALDFARCMRAHGVDIPDPQVGNGGIGIKIQGGSGAGQINPDDPTFQNAQKACGGQLGKIGSVHVGTTGGGGGGAIGFGSAVAAG